MNHFSRESISPLLINLHWLPIRQRILYKLLLLTHKAIHHNSPSYLTSLILLQPLPTTTTRSTKPSSSKYNKYSTNLRSWLIVAPYSWNSIPIKLRCITNSSTLKTYLKHTSSQLPTNFNKTIRRPIVYLSTVAVYKI